ncbi:MAG: hypothetical protein ACLFNA_07170, partial [Halochromatium sp.]
MLDRPWPLGWLPDAREAALAQRAAELDRAAFAQAERLDSEAAYRAYLADCRVTGCAHRERAEQRLADLRAGSAPASSSADSRPGAADLEAYRQAMERDTEAAYR